MTYNQDPWEGGVRGFRVKTTTYKEDIHVSDLRVRCLFLINKIYTDRQDEGRFLTYY